jgi:hypothetical protein
MRQAQRQRALKPHVSCQALFHVFMFNVLPVPLRFYSEP